MAFDPTPTTWIPNWSEDGTNITVPIASFAELTAAEADAATGDIRKIAFAICKQLSDAWIATASADRPTKMIINTSSSVDTTTGVLTHVFTFQFRNEILTQDVANES